MITKCNVKSDCKAISFGAYANNCSGAVHTKIKAMWQNGGTGPRRAINVA